MPRVLAIDGLGLLHDAGALHDIVPLLESSNSQFVAAAVRYLSRIDDERAREVLRRAAATLDEIYLVEVADGLAAQRDRQAIALLVEIGLHRDLQRRNEIRSRVAMALAEIGGAEAWANAVEVTRLIDAPDHCQWTIDAVAQKVRSRLAESRPDERVAMEEALRELGALKCPSH
jgi:HEAT repeat protein